MNHSGASAVSSVVRLNTLKYDLSFHGIFCDLSAIVLTLD